MRYYGTDYKDAYLRMLDNIRDSMSEESYSQRIGTTEVSSAFYHLKLECMDAGDEADARFTLIRNKIEVYKSLISELYDELDASADEIYTNAFKAKMTITYLNNALVNLTDALNGSGQYKGSVVLPTDIAKAGSSMISASQKLTEYWKEYFTNPDGSFDERNVEKYFEYTAELLAKGSKNEFQTDCLADLINNYLAQNNYSDESYTTMLNMLTKYAMEEVETDKNRPQDAKYGKAKGKECVFFYNVSDSYNYLVARAYDKMKTDFAENGDPNGDLAKCANLYDCMDAVSAGGGIALASFLNKDQCAAYEGNENGLIDFARKQIGPDFNVKIMTDDKGERYAKLTYSGNNNGYPNKFYYATASKAGCDYEKKIDSIDVYSCRSDISFKTDTTAATQDDSNKDKSTTVDSIATDLKSYQMSEVTDTGSNAATETGSEGTTSEESKTEESAKEASATKSGGGSGYSGGHSGGYSGGSSSGTSDYASKANYYTNSGASGSYWSVNSGKESKVTASPHFFTTPQKVQTYFCYAYYCNNTDEVLEPTSPVANRMIHDTPITPKTPAISYRNFQLQLKNYWSDYCKCQGYRKPPCATNKMTPKDLTALTYSLRETTEKAGTYNTSKGYVSGSYDYTIFDKLKIDLSAYLSK